MFRSIPAQASGMYASEDVYAREIMIPRVKRQDKKPLYRRTRLRRMREKKRDLKGWTVVSVRPGRCITAARKFYLECQRADRKRAKAQSNGSTE